MSTWIWNFGDFEMYHGQEVHNRRVGYGREIAPMWKIYRPEPNVRFEKTITTEGGTFTVYAQGKGEVVTYGSPDRYSLLNRRYQFGEEIILTPGTWRIQVQVMNLDTFPAVYAEGLIETDESWVCDDVSGDWRPVGTWDVLDSAEKRPEIFPFAHEAVAWASREALNDGMLYDYGKELFASLTFSGITGPTEVRLGESVEETQDPEYCVIHYTLDPRHSEVPGSGFRYVWVSDPAVEPAAISESLPIQNRARFSCEDPVTQWVWDTAAYTLFLNSREFFYDGIKRDRWVWSADAYQTQFVNHYSFFDPEVEKRTLIELGGKRPFVEHINTIIDYTFFWIMGIWEYYRTYGDRHFVEQMLPQMHEVMDFITSRLSEDGFIRGQKADWTFIDWNDSIDKTGAVLGEQILLAEAMDNYGRMLGVLGLDGQPFLAKALLLRQAILEKYWDPAQGAFIDSFESGKANVSRHGNLWAYLYLPLSDSQKQQIYANVVCNDAVPAITTPYFKFYENQVHCEAGDPYHKLEDSIRNYYGPMQDLGATALFEQFDPTQQGVEHYAMYNMPFDKSLCHAWSSSPIYLIGAYRLGVKNTGIAYDTFEVKPLMGDLPAFEGTVPLPKGEVWVQVTPAKVRVKSTVPAVRW